MKYFLSTGPVFQEPHKVHKDGLKHT